LDWRLKGQWLKNCNCDFGCPCDFDAPPTNGECVGMMAMKVIEGHRGRVRLDGLCFVLVLSFPGPLHEGNGTMQIVIDEDAGVAQREALRAILSGEEAEPGTLFHNLNTFVRTAHKPVFAHIDFDFNLDHRTAYVIVPGIVESTSQPILNRVTGAARRIRVQLAEGLEYLDGEVANAATRGLGKIRFDIEAGHGTLALVEHTPRGLAA
jgi:hypothetical protein